MTAKIFLSRSARLAGRSAIVAPNAPVIRESGLLTCNSILKTALFAAALSGALALDGCGRRGPPVPLDPEVAAKAAEAPAIADRDRPDRQFAAAAAEGARR